MKVIHHELHPEDAETVANMREMIAAAPRPEFIPSFRPTFDEIIAYTPPADGVDFTPGVVGGVRGWWCNPADAVAGAAVLYLHGGGYVLGSSIAYKNLVAQIAKRARAVSFIADYALAPEQPFPAAPNDVEATYNGIASLGFERIALCGDSAGGGLALSHIQRIGGRDSRLVGAVAMSPWIDLSLSGKSMVSRADEDPLISRETLTHAAEQFLSVSDFRDPRLQTLAGDFSQLPPIQIHVGAAEVLLDDALRFAARAQEADRICDVHVWAGMMHVFPSNVTMLHAARQALEGVGAFLAAFLHHSAAQQTSH